MIGEILNKSLEEWRVDKHSGMIGVQADIDARNAASESFVEDVEAKDLVYVWFGNEVAYTTRKAAVGMKLATAAEAERWRIYAHRYIKGGAARDLDKVNANIARIGTALKARAA